MRNFYHCVIGFAIGYIFLIVTGINKFPLTIEYWNNWLSPLIGGFIGLAVGYIWEDWQSNKYHSPFDINDILRTGLGALLGSIVSLFFTSYILILLLLLITSYLLYKEFKK